MASRRSGTSPAAIPGTDSTRRLPTDRHGKPPHRDRELPRTRGTPVPVISRDTDPPDSHRPGTPVVPASRVSQAIRATRDSPDGGRGRRTHRPVSSRPTVNRRGIRPAGNPRIRRRHRRHRSTGVTRRNRDTRAHHLPVSRTRPTSGNHSGNSPRVLLATASSTPHRLLDSPAAPGSSLLPGGKRSPHRDSPALRLPSPLRATPRRGTRRAVVDTVVGSLRGVSRRRDPGSPTSPTNRRSRHGQICPVPTVSPDPPGSTTALPLRRGTSHPASRDNRRPQARRRVNSPRTGPRPEESRNRLPDRACRPTYPATCRGRAIRQGFPARTVLRRTCTPTIPRTVRWRWSRTWVASSCRASAGSPP